MKGSPPPLLNADDAVKLVNSGDRIYMHGVASFPTVLASALAKRRELRNVEIDHLHIIPENPCSTTELKDSFFVSNYFIGPNQRKQVAEGISSLIPCFLSDLPKLMRNGVRSTDVAFLNVSTPDKHGFCSLGLEVCTALAAVETAKLVIAQINPNVPRTHGQSFVHINSFDAIVDVNEPIPEIAPAKASPVELAIGKHLAELIPDGATLQMGIGGIPNAVLECLKNHKNLGIHTEMFSDGVIALIESGVVNNSQKFHFPHTTVTAFAMGTKRLYDFVDDNPSIHFNDISVVNDPSVIGKNPKVTAINAAVEVDITGQVCADSVGSRMISGVGGQCDFEYGASISKGGLPIICLPSIAKSGGSTIVPFLKQGAGITTTRNHVHYVVTENGIAYLFGKNLLERAKAMIKIAHPSHQDELSKQAYERFKVLI
ncbi:hypothetical protein HDV01_005121 [Terramyces sp. JEL0728]|nr:hypothetical protein HDV01_005121 [Terramyces sp. JEL0728]